MAGILVLTVCYLNLKPEQGLLARFGQTAMEEHILTGYSTLYNVWRITAYLLFPLAVLVFMQVSLSRRWKILFYVGLGIYFIFSLTHLYAFVASTIMLSLVVRPKSRAYFAEAKPVEAGQLQVALSKLALKLRFNRNGGEW